MYSTLRCFGAFTKIFIGRTTPWLLGVLGHTLILASIKRAPNNPLVKRLDPKLSARDLQTTDWSLLSPSSLHGDALETMTKEAAEEERRSIAVFFLACGFVCVLQERWSASAKETSKGKLNRSRSARAPQVTKAEAHRGRSGGSKERFFGRGCHMWNAGTRTGDLESFGFVQDAWNVSLCSWAVLEHYFRNRQLQKSFPTTTPSCQCH